MQGSLSPLSFDSYCDEDDADADDNDAANDNDSPDADDDADSDDDEKELAHFLQGSLSPLSFDSSRFSAQIGQSGKKRFLFFLSFFL